MEALPNAEIDGKEDSSHVRKTDDASDFQSCDGMKCEERKSREAGKN